MSDEPLTIIRDHDKLYLAEDRKHQPKESFKFLADCADSFLRSRPQPRILDVGCATGDLLYFLASRYPQARLGGMDVMPELIERARAEVPAATFVEGNIYTGEGVPAEVFDAVLMSGVHSIFDQHEPWLDQLLRLAGERGKVYIFGIFNPENLDVRIKVRASGTEGPWQSGWNLLSKETVSAYLRTRGRAFRFHDWEIPIDLAPNPEDPLRSWTVRLANGRRQIVNGLQLIHTFSVLEIN